MTIPGLVASTPHHIKTLYYYAHPLQTTARIYTAHVDFITHTTAWTTNKMAATAKYQDVPQRDSFEGAGYSQPPPSYQAEPVPGDARSEDDNVPDDFKVCGPCSSSHLWQEANIL
jgi:hypothetical protein